MERRGKVCLGFPLKKKKGSFDRTHLHNLGRRWGEEIGEDKEKNMFGGAFGNRNPIYCTEFVICFNLHITISTFLVLQTLEGGLGCERSID